MIFFIRQQNKFNRKAKNSLKRKKLELILNKKKKKYYIK
jgi:hypothetical protein